MTVPMPFVPSTSSDHTPPSQVPHYWNWLFPRFFTPMRDGDARAITEQDGVSSLTNHLVQFIYLLLGSEDELIQRFAKMFQLSRRDDAWRLAIEWIEAVFFCRPLPGA